jgi:hypothetical protein
MRQRLLLVAGWVLAAVGTSVVASAAVAATGGQVTDRALRPLTAAEVAALPEGFLEVLSESLASGDSSNRDLVEPGESTTVGPTAQAPAGAEGETRPADLTDDAPIALPRPPTDDVDIEDDADATEPDPGVDPEPTATFDTHIEHLEAGSVSLVGTDDQIRLLWATPRIGWRMDVEYLEPNHLLLSFANDETLWTLNAAMVDGAIEVETQEVRGGVR